MLFQPSNILPDVINGTGNGTIDMFQGLSVSWQVNGNSQMTAYKIDILNNNEGSTLLYTTDKVTLTNPFSGVDYRGNIQRFTATTIPYATLNTAGMTYGNEYKLKITQYYTDANILIPGTTPEEKTVEQRSLSVFYVRYYPDVTIASISNNTVTTREYSFTASYIQRDGDVMSWARWELYRDTGEVDYSQTMQNQKAYQSNLLYDTGRMYGVSVLQFNYDAFLNNTDYFLSLTVETSYGVQARVTKRFSTEWSEAVLATEVDPVAKRVNRQSTAVKVVWNGFKYITGVPSGDVQVRNGTAILSGTSSSVYWNEINGSSLNLATPWVFMMQTKLNRDSATLVKLYNTYGSTIMQIAYDVSTRAITFSAPGVTSVTDSPIEYDATIKIMVTPTNYQIQAEGYTGDLKPSATLQPSATLVPNEIKSAYVYRPQAYTISHFTQDIIRKIEVTGTQDIDFIQIVCGSDNTTDAKITAMKTRLFEVANPYNPNYNTFSGTEFLASFDNDNLDAGSLTVAGTTITGWAVYRESERLNEIIHLTDTEVGMSSLYDYGCGSNQGRYRYSVYPIGDQKYITAGLHTNWIEPCYENWAIVEAVNTGADTYKVINEYVFGKNFSSGSVGNNNAPTVSKNFTPYATVQMDNSNYQAGTLSGLIGYIGYVSYVVQEGDTLDEIAARFDTTSDQIIADNDNVSGYVKEGQIIKVFYPRGITAYHDDKELRDSIWALSTTQHYLFLKSRKGDVIEIRIAGEISMDTMDASAILPTSVSLPWVQVGDATRARLIGGVS